MSILKYVKAVVGFGTVPNICETPKSGRDYHDMSEIYCPVCGFYCLGNGGHGCIDKPRLVGISPKEANTNYDDLLASYNALRSALIWWLECSEGHDDHGWGFWLEDDATEELAATCNAAWAEVERTLEATE